MKLCIFYVFSPMATGRQFIAAEELLFSARHASYWESLDAGINCFMLAIEVCRRDMAHLRGGRGVKFYLFSRHM